MMWCFDSDKLDAALAAFLSGRLGESNQTNVQLLERAVRVFLEKGPVTRIPLTRPQAHFWWSFDEAQLGRATAEFTASTAPDLELAGEFCTTSAVAFLRSHEARKLRVAELDGQPSGGEKR